MMEKEIFQDSDDDKRQEHIDKIFEEDITLSRHINTFFDSILGSIMETSLGIELEKAEKVILANVPRMSQLRRSFFLDPEKGEE
jgi:hypothetical protein